MSKRASHPQDIFDAMNLVDKGKETEGQFPEINANQLGMYMAMKTPTPEKVYNDLDSIDPPGWRNMSEEERKQESEAIWERRIKPYLPPEGFKIVIR